MKAKIHGSRLVKRHKKSPQAELFELPRSETWVDPDEGDLIQKYLDSSPPAFWPADNKHLNRYIDKALTTGKGGSEYGRRLERGHGWRLLLHELKKHVKSAKGRKSISSMPGIELHRRLWDVFPDERGKTIASTELFHLLVIVRRMGAIWQPLSQDSVNSLETILQAEGNGHIFQSTHVRGLGLAVMYQSVGSAKDTLDTMPEKTKNHDASNYIDVWSTEANKFMFGCISRNPKFGFQKDFNITSLEDLVLIWNNHGYLDIPWQENETTWQNLFRGKQEHRNSQLRHATNDLIALVCPMIRPKEPIVAHSRVRLHFAANFENMFRGFTFGGDSLGREHFVKFLRAMNDESQFIKDILQIAEKLSKDKDFNGPKVVAKILTKAYEGYEQSTKYFEQIDATYSSLVSVRTAEPPEIRPTTPCRIASTISLSQFYRHLVKAHLSNSPHIHGSAMTYVKQKKDVRRRGVYRRRIRVHRCNSC